MPNLEKGKEFSSEGLLFNEEKKRVLEGSKDSLNNLKREFTKMKISKEIDSQLNNMEWKEDYKDAIERFLNFDYSPKVKKLMSEAFGDKTFESIKAVSKRYMGSYEELFEFKKVELLKLLYLMEGTLGDYELSKRGEQKDYRKESYMVFKSKLEKRAERLNDRNVK